MNGTSWLLGGGYPWYTGDPVRPTGAAPSPVVANVVQGLSLATLSNGPLGLESADGSLGRLTLPRGIALDGDTVVVLSEDGARVFLYDSIRTTLTPLAEIGATADQRVSESGSKARRKRRCFVSAEGMTRHSRMGAV